MAHLRVTQAASERKGSAAGLYESAGFPDRVLMCASAPKFTVRTYRFAEEQEEHERGHPKSELVVLIPEVLDPQYGMYVWPCAVVLAQYIWFHRKLVCDKRILELGAGVSLPGIVAAKCGAEIILSDNAALPQCLDNCHRSSQMNNLSGVFVTGLTWGQISPALSALPPVDIILASDVFFEPEDFEDVVSTVHYLMEKNPHAQFWTTYQVRSADWSIQGLLYKWEMESACIPLQSFEANKEQLADSPLPGRHTVEMMVITKVNVTQSLRTS
ncbi:histone-arginine methyltransferase METTL23 [Eublepharis macularius]|uniref:Histone-arginine methyltransferase METTL23 n=1 Tax=Eublepharis macularius TaxID=481883 RepID=A0AA97JAM1_EUBMA|nr:histone-arginine methyltransferase METTL23 [Eublepharis macularius]XP_054834712.1 histone-arginine methyltransferase METTL23 [Eublepharis macularius]